MSAPTAERPGLRQPRTLRYTLRTLALVYLGLLVAVPVLMILVRAFGPGLATWWSWVTTPASIAALNLTLLIIVLVVPLNAVFGVITALALARGRFPGRGLLQTVVDLPFAVSPVVAGVAMIALWGIHGWFGFLPGNGIRIIYALPGLVLATSFVTLPFVVREVEPVLREIGTDQEQAAATLGANRWQVFGRITLPAIRWGLTYGIVLTISRALGEYGAVLLVSSNLPGVSQTLTLLVHGRFVDDHNVYGAYAASTVLMGLALLTLLVTILLDLWKKHR